MAIPDYQQCMLPTLEILSDGLEHKLRDLTKAVADRFELSDLEREELLPSGQQTVIANRVAWSKSNRSQPGGIGGGKLVFSGERISATP